MSKSKYFDEPKNSGIATKGEVAGGIAIICAIGAIIFGISSSIVNWQNGIYGGYHYGDAVDGMIHVMADQYGLKQAEEMKLASPPVINTHLRAIKQKPTASSPIIGLTGDPQVRLFHLVGPQGVKYCTGIWDPASGTDIAQKFVIIKDCNFAENK